LFSKWKPDPQPRRSSQTRRRRPCPDEKGGDRRDEEASFNCNERESPPNHTGKAYDPMPRLLVVVDGTAEASLALDRAMDVAEAVPGSELVLLGVEPEPRAWDRKQSKRRRTAFGEILSRASTTAALRKIPARTRMEMGEKGDVVTRIASDEKCDQIFVSEPRRTIAARAMLAIAAACTGRVAARIIDETGVPVTVVAPKPAR
jgi:nucleotide-binding universal stress UspA family protein